MELKIIIKFEDREIILTETEALMLHNKLSEMFDKVYTYPVYPTQPISPTYDPLTPWCRVEPFTKEEMCDIREELDKGIKSVDWSYYGGLTMGPVSE